MPELNTLEILQKWGLVLDALNIIDEDKRMYMSQYAEWHLKNTFNKTKVAESCHVESDSIYNEIDPYSEENWGESSNKPNDRLYDSNLDVLSISLKILSLLNIKNKNVIFEELPINFTMHYDMSVEPFFHELLEGNIYTMLNSLAKMINEKLETKENLHLNLIVADIKVNNFEIITTSSFTIN
jgi:hypothetical protein